MKRNELLLPKRLLTGQIMSSLVHLIFYLSNMSTGYIPGAEGLSAVSELVRNLKQEKPELIYVLDRESVL